MCCVFDGLDVGVIQTVVETVDSVSSSCYCFCNHLVIGSASGNSFAVDQEIALTRLEARLELSDLSQYCDHAFSDGLLVLGSNTLCRLDFVFDRFAVFLGNQGVMQTRHCVIVNTQTRSFSFGSFDTVSFNLGEINKVVLELGQAGFILLDSCSCIFSGFFTTEERLDPSPDTVEEIHDSFPNLGDPFSESFGSYHVLTQLSFLSCNAFNGSAKACFM